MNVAGVHAVVRWQASQLCVVGRWFDGFPVAIVPLWHVAQEPAVTPLWLNVAGIQAVVRWHASQLCVVGRWFDGFPVAVVPLWHVAQEPAVTPL